MFYDFYVGSYALADHESIYRYQLNEENGTLRRTEAIKGVDNPSWLLIHPNGKFLYSVEELNPEGRVAVYRRESDALKYLFSLKTEGADPCHLSLSPEARLLFAANYSSGSLSVFRLDSSGRPEGMTDHKQHVGRGINPDRQESPHVHFSQMIEGRLCVCDLGIDRIVVYEPDEKTGKLAKCGEDICLLPGFGPRHLAAHETHRNFLYVLGELTGDVCVLQKAEGRYRMLQRVSSLPENCTCRNACGRGFAGKDIAVGDSGERKAAGENAVVENTAAAIKFSKDGRLLFVSNRGADTITSFLVQADGRIEKAACVSSGGSGPRDFAVFGGYLVAANQYSDNLALIKFHGKSGEMELLPVSEPVSKPVMIAGIPDNGKLL